jgi:hypothetical protein
VLCTGASKRAAEATPEPTKASQPASQPVFRTGASKCAPPVFQGQSEATQHIAKFGASELAPQPSPGASQRATHARSRVVSHLLATKVISNFINLFQTFLNLPSKFCHVLTPFPHIEIFNYYYHCTAQDSVYEAQDFPQDLSFMQVVYQAGWN